jgi:EAL and modified HD-GYP domain-containing signal transduction protein
MTDVFVGRQPIFDRRGRVVGYELLFRDGKADSAVIVDQEAATATVVLNTVTEIGFEQVVGGHPAWINVSSEFVRNGLVQLLPPALLVFEILEGQAIDDQMLATVAELKRRGYRFALDDFVYSLDTEPLLGFVDFVKLDLLALGNRRLSRMINRLEPYDIRFVAEKVETQEDYAFCARAGCDFFQGYFFCRPELMRGRRIDSNRAALLDLLAALHDPEAELAELHRKIALDVGLSLRLLRYINSPFFGLREKVRSIGQAAALLGLDHLKQWATLTALTSIANKPAELALTALIRARFCELAAHDQIDLNANEMFTLGLFSVIDALLDTPMTQLLARLPFASDVCEALVEHKGPKGEILECLSALETGDLATAEAILPTAGQLYVLALAWADDAAAPLLAESVESDETVRVRNHRVSDLLDGRLADPRRGW